MTDAAPPAVAEETPVEPPPLVKLGQLIQANSAGAIGGEVTNASVAIASSLAPAADHLRDADDIRLNHSGNYLVQRMEDLYKKYSNKF